MPTRLTPELEAEIKRRAQFANVPDDIHALLAEIDALREELDDTKMALGLERADNAFKTALWETAIRDTAQLREELAVVKEEALEWSNEPPLTVGQYWYWGTAGKEVVQLDQYIKNESAARSGWLVWRWGYGGRFFVEDSSGARWAGPIALPPQGS